MATARMRRRRVSGSLVTFQDNNGVYFRDFKANAGNNLRIGKIWGQILKRRIASPADGFRLPKNHILTDFPVSANPEFSRPLCQPLAPWKRWRNGIAAVAIPEAERLRKIHAAEMKDGLRNP